MSSRRPWKRNTKLHRDSAVSKAVGFEGCLESGIKWQDLEKQSMTVSIVVLPLDLGRSVIKSIAR